MTTAGYSGRPLHVKLGVKPDSRVLLVFCPDLAELHRWYDQARARITTAGALWIAWPKKSSDIRTDIDENLVREHALANGLVDVKVCAVDQVWSGLKLVRRPADR